MVKNIVQTIAELQAEIVEQFGWDAVPRFEPWDDAVTYANELLIVLER